MNQNNISFKAVIKGLECCQECNVYICRNFCPYHGMDQGDGQSTCMYSLAGDALTLLKERECATVEPKCLELSDETRAWLDKMDAVEMLSNIADICIDWDGCRTPNALGALIDEIWAYARYGADKLMKEQLQRDYEAATEMTEYCERYEPTYNPEDGSL